MNKQKCKRENLGGKVIEDAGASPSKSTMLSSVDALVVFLFFFGGPLQKYGVNKGVIFSLEIGFMLAQY